MVKYVLKANEAILVPIKPSKIPSVVRKGVVAVWAAILLFSLLIGENLLNEMNGITLVMLVGLSLTALLYSPKKEYQPSEIELQFYDDKLILYRPQCYYDESTTRREICELRYCDITECLFKARSCRIHIYGDGVITWYNMKKDGTFPEKPSKVKHFKKGLLFFSTRCAADIDFVKEIEAHSPLRVNVENN